MEENLSDFYNRYLEQQLLDMQSENMCVDIENLSYIGMGVLQELTSQKVTMEELKNLVCCLNRQCDLNAYYGIKVICFEK